MIDALDGLDRVPWPELHHANGPASDVPDQLRALRSPDSAARDWAAFELMGTVYHQGARWPVSSHVVPFLVALIDDRLTPDRAVVARLLRAVTVGDRTDQDLPFAPDVTFAAADAGAGAGRWDRDAYTAGRRHTARYARWLEDPDTELAARAAELLAWFPPTPVSLVGLIAMFPDPARWQPRASANLALAHLPAGAPGMPETLRVQLHSNPLPVRLTAAIALAYRLGDELPPAALDVLEAAPRELSPADDQVLPWGRSLTGFAALALRRAGLT